MLPPPAHIVSLDACADQYVLALAPRERIVGLSYRALAADSLFRIRAAGLPRIRPTLEGVLAAHPDAVARTWGGEPKLLEALKARGVRIIQIPDAEDFEQVAARTTEVAEAVGAPQAGRLWNAQMQANLSAAQGLRSGQTGLYLTSGGFTAGPGVFADAILRASGLRNAVTAPSYASMPLERLIRQPPQRIVAAFFESGSAPHWGPGQSETVQRLLRRPTTLRLPAWALSCPTPASAQAALDLARQVKAEAK